ncbi:MAG: peptidoglycan-binding protein [Zhengella sp.]|uniref:peptidoglycan-binding protein n=1 Tax=Zhengella sp. TaxID=2282762 RepID=UPI003528FF1C|nr:SEL1-like repeat protein [Brucellaceae bacterium]
MNDKKSYLGSLNAGRERRSGAILDDITEKLDALERRISGERMAMPAKPARRDAAPSPSPRRPARSNLYNDIAHDLERARERSDEFGSISRISHDLQALREELRQEMSHGIRQEFDSLRRQMADFYQDVQAGLSSRELAPELERIAAGVASLSERSGNRDVMALRHDVEELRETVEALAREETLQSVNNRWDDFDRRWDRIADHIEGGMEASGRADAMFDRLSERMEAIYDALAQVPSRSVMASLEDKVRMLTEAVGQIADAQARIPPDLFGMVEDRLDEISRAIVASSVSAEPVQLDTAPLERIEARISALANQINEVAAQDNGALVEQLHVLTQRVDDLARERDLPSEDLERIATQMASITRILTDSPAPPDMAVILDGVEQRINALGATLEDRTHSASRQSMTLFKDLEGRIGDLAGKIEALPRANEGEHASDIDARLRDLTARLEESTRRQSKSEAALLTTLDERLQGFQKELESRQAAAPVDTRAIANIEARLEAISAHLDEASRAILPEADASLVATLGSRLDEIASRLDETSRNAEAADRSLIEHLETQVADMARFMSNPGSNLPELENLTPRLEEIERALASNHETILQTAQRAAEDALRTASAHNAAHHDAVAALAEDLKSLDKLARRSEERNTKTFEAIHETLLKIVDRLATLEASGTEGKPDERAALADAPQPEPARKAAKRTVQQAPSIDTAEVFDDAEPLSEAAGDTRAAPAVSPSQAAAAAALAALQDGDTAVMAEDDRRPSMLNGLTRALRGKKQAAPQEPSMEGAPVLDDEQDDTPLAPGDSAPDLTAIMEKVRADREAERAGDPDAAKADFIAAARRAAQAAAAEAEMLKGKTTLGSAGSRLSLATLLQEKRKPVLMAAGAVMILLAGLQVGKMVLSGNEDVPVAAEQGSLSEPDTGTTAEIPARQIMPDATAETGDADGSTNAIAADTDSIEPAIPELEADAGDIMPPDVIASGDAGETGGTAMADETTGDDGADAPAIAFGPVALREAVAAGDPKAFFEVGNRYTEGRGVAASPETAAEWYARSAEAGFAPGQYRYGNLLEKGIGVERDLEGAKTWYQLAAQQGNASAMHNLAVLFATGADGVTDNTSAVRWFMEAAELGVKDSQFNLGILAAKGVGMKQDLEESYKWFAVAARNGDKDAAQKRDEVAKAMRPEQLDRARAKADLWKPRTPDLEANTPSIPEGWTVSNETTASVDMTKAVRNIQLILNKNGFDAGAPDGIMGDKTKQAIRDFQSAHGLPATGEVDNALVSKLLDMK